MMPRLTKLSSLPLLVNGKTDRQALLQKYEETLACTSFSFTDEDFTGHVEAALFPQAKVVLESVASVLRDVSRKPSLADAFFEMGGDSINMVLVIARINDHGYHISMTQFVLASTLADVVMALSTQQEDDDIGAVIEKMKKSSEYTSADLEGDHKKVVLDMISRSFAEKGDLTTLAAVSYEVLQDQLEILWPALLEAKLSIVVKDKSGRLIGACLNFDARSEEAAPLCAQSAFSRNMTEEERKAEREARKKRIADGEEEVPMSVVEFLDAVEEPLKDGHIPPGKGHFIYTSLLGTAKDLSTAENVQVAIYMEQENIRLGKARGFKGIFTTNANRLTQLISRSLGYQILSTIQVNQYEDIHGGRPFASAPDDLVTEVALKRF